MKSDSQRPVRLLAAATAAVMTYALSGCGDEPAPKPGASPAPPPQAAVKTAPQPPAPQQPAAANAQAENDRALAAKVKAALGAAPGLNVHQMDVVSRDGVVTLFGTTETREQREQAARLAAAVPGVQSVESKLAVVAGS